MIFTKERFQKLAGILTESDASKNPPETLLDIPVGQMKTVDDFQTYLQRLPKTSLAKLQLEIDTINKEHASQFEGMQTLYHGTTKKKAEKIRRGGFELTAGERSGFMGSTKVVQNQAIFLSGDKGIAHAFGANRDPYGGPEADTIEVKADIHNTLDMTRWGKQIPLDIRKYVVAKLSEYEGADIKRPKQEDMFWMIDQPEIVELIKKSGYDSVRFAESTATKRAMGLEKSSGDTVAVFDPLKLHIAVVPLRNLRDIFEYVKHLAT